MVDYVWESARQKAKEVLDENWDQKLPVDIKSICRASGVNTYMRLLPDNLSGMIVKHSDQDDADAFIDEGEPEVRQRFTLAHELGHFIERTQVAQDGEFGFKEIRSNAPGKAAYFPHEFFADEFAGSVLMPEKKVKEFQDKKMGIDEMAEQFQVSVAAVKQRIKSLKERHEEETEA